MQSSLALSIVIFFLQLEDLSTSRGIDKDKVSVGTEMPEVCPDVKCFKYI